jgi:hypothetical protein
MRASSIQGSRWLPALAAAVALALLPGQQAVSSGDSGEAWALPVIEVWYVVPQEEASLELSMLQGEMRTYANEHFADMGIAFFERVYADDDAFLSFFHYPDLAAEREGRNTRSSDAKWVQMFQQLVSSTLDEESYRSILMPVAGPARETKPKDCRIFSRSRIPPFARATAQRRARELVDHLNETYEGLAAYAYIDDLGDPHDLYLFFDHEALWERNPMGVSTSWEANRRALLEDERYEELLGALGEVLEEPMAEIVASTLR